VGDLGFGFFNAGGEVAVVSFGLVGAGFLLSAVAALAFAAAVGAVADDCRSDGWLVFGFGAAALTGSFVTGFAAGLAVAAVFDNGAAALEAGAAAEGFTLVGVLGIVFGNGLLRGVLLDVEALVVEMAAGLVGSSLPFFAGVPFALTLLDAGLGVFVAGAALAGFNSSAGAGRALPPETADASVGSAGLRDTSSCAPVVALSGFSAGVSSTGSGAASASFTGSSSTTASSGAGASSG
jgi:hypothetical protein